MTGNVSDRADKWWFRSAAPRWRSNIFPFRENIAPRARARKREREKSALVTLGSPGGSALFRSIPWTFIRSLYSILLVRLSSSLRGFLRLRVRAHPHRDRTPRWRARSETRSRARQRSVCEQVQARCILCIPAGSRSHPASHVSPCSASVRACPSFFLLFLFAARPRRARVPHDAVFRSPSLSLSLFLCFQSTLQPGIFHEDLQFPIERASGNRSLWCCGWSQAESNGCSKPRHMLGVDDKARTRARL